MPAIISDGFLADWQKKLKEVSGDESDSQEMDNLFNYRREIRRHHEPAEDDTPVRPD